MITEKEKTRTITEKIFVTSDGEEFNNKRDAQRHEDYLLPRRQILSYHCNLTIDDRETILYKIKSKEDLEYLNATQWQRNAWIEYDGSGWYVAFTNPGGDYIDSYDVIAVKNFLNDLKKDINTLKEICEE